MRQRTGATRLGDDRAGQLGADARDFFQPHDRGQRRGVRHGPGAGAGDAVGVGAPCRGDRVDGFLDQQGEPGDPLAEEVDLVQQDLGDLGVVAGELAVERLGQGGVLGSHPGAGQPGQHDRVALPGDHRPDHVLHRPGGHLGGDRGHLDQGVLEQLLQPLPAPGPVLGQVGPRPAVVPQRPDVRGRHEAGPQQPVLGQPGQPHRVQLVGLRPAGQLPGRAGRYQLHVQPGRLQQVEPDPPVIAGNPG